MRSTEILSVRVKRALLSPLKVAAGCAGVSRNKFCCEALRDAILRSLEKQDPAKRLLRGENAKTEHKR